MCVYERPRRSVTTNLMSLSMAAHEVFESSCQLLDVVYGDFQYAFDKVIIRNLVTE